MVFCEDCSVAELVDVSDVPLGGKTVEGELRVHAVKSGHRAYSGHVRLLEEGGFVGQKLNQNVITRTVEERELVLGKLERR